MNYQKAVAEGRRLVKRSEEDSWRLAELTFDVVSAGKSRNQWAKDLGVSPSTAGYWFRVWERWRLQEPADRPRFQDAFETVLGGSDELLDAAKARSDRHGRQLPTEPEERAKLAQKLLADPEVRKHPVVREEAEEVAKEVDAERQARWADVKPLPPLDPQSEAGPYTWDYLGLKSGEVPLAVHELLRELQKVKTPLPAKLRDDVLEDVAETRNALDFVETAVTGVVDWDAGLDKLLNEER